MKYKMKSMRPSKKKTTEIQNSPKMFSFLYIHPTNHPFTHLHPYINKKDLKYYSLPTTYNFQNFLIPTLSTEKKYKYTKYFFLHLHVSFTFVLETTVKKVKPSQKVK